jgi:hypothetical protein
MANISHPYGRLIARFELTSWDARCFRTESKLAFRVPGGDCGGTQVSDHQGARLGSTRHAAGRNVTYAKDALRPAGIPGRPEICAERGQR